ncbi:MAG TPA: hypothetical protein VK154_08595 [Chitinophagales bacterium]|nr:hypothetical protein [Chitinophagales bacterium]
MMTRFMFLIVWPAMLAVVNVCAQLPTIGIPGHKLQPGMAPGTVVSTRIVNTGAAPASFLFSYPVKGEERHFATAQGHTAWLLSHIKPGMDSTQARLELIKAEAQFRRSRFFANWTQPMSAYEADVPDSAFVRMYSGNTTTGWFYITCQEAFSSFYTNLIATGYFSAGQFRNVNLLSHIAGEVQVGKEWIYVDVNVSSTATALTPDKGSKLGYASAAAIKKNRGLLQPYVWARAGGRDSLAASEPLSLNSIEVYRSKFDSVSYSPVLWQPGYGHDGVVVLPAGAALVWTDTIGRVKDITAPGVYDTIKELSRVMGKIKGEPGRALIDSLNGLLAVAGLTVEDFMNFRDPRNVIFFTGRQAYPSLSWSHPTMQIETNDGSDYAVGKGIKFPGFVMGVEGTVTFADTTLHNTSLTLWGKMDEGKPRVAYKALHFLDGEGKVKGGSKIALSYNPMLGPDFYRGAQIDQLGERDQLKIEMLVNKQVVYSYDTPGGK